MLSAIKLEPAGGLNLSVYGRDGGGSNAARAVRNVEAYRAGSIAQEIGRQGFTVKGMPIPCKEGKGWASRRAAILRKPERLVLHYFRYDVRGAGAEVPVPDVHCFNV